MALTRITKGVIKPNENYDTHNINSTGIVTAIGLDVNGNGDISGNLSVGGVLTYEDVTSIDSVGIITARNGIDCNGDIDVDGHTNLDNVSIAGVTTFSNTVHVGTGVTIETNGQATFTGITTARVFDVGYSDNAITYGYFQAGRIKIFDNGSHCHIRFGDHPSYSPHQMYSSSVVNRTNSYYMQNTGATRYAIGWVHGSNHASGQGSVNLYYSGGYAPDYGVKLSTHSGGILVSGVTTTRDLAVTGVSTFTGNIDANGDLDVDGHTNLDNVNIAGVTSTTGVFVINAGTQSTNKTTGALRVTGGAGIQGNVNVGGDLDVDGHTNLDNVSIAGVTTFTGRSDHSSSLQMLNGNNIVLLNDANSANCQIDCYGGAGFRLTSYNQTMFTCENGSNTKFYTNSGTSRLEITHAGDVLVNTGSLYIPDALTHSGDTNTKIRFPAADTFSVETAGSERLRISNTGNVGIKSTAPRGKLDIQFDGAPNFITFGSDADNPKVEFFRHTGGSPSHYATEIQMVLGDLVLSTAATANLGSHSYTERFRIRSDGKIVRGHTTIYPVAGHYPALQLTGTTFNDATFGIINNTNDATGAYIQLSKQRSGSPGGATIVQNDDLVGQITFTAADGTDLTSRTAEIKGFVDGTPGSNDTPGRLSFWTTPDGAQSSLERLRITSSGEILLPASGANRISMRHSGGGAAVIKNPSAANLSFGTNNQDAEFVIQNGGKVLISNTLGLGGATSNPSGLLHCQAPSGEGVVKVIGATNAVIQLSGYNGDSTIQFGDASSDSPGKIKYNHAGDDFIFTAGGATRGRIYDNAGVTGIEHHQFHPFLIGYDASISDNVTMVPRFGGMSALPINQDGDKAYMSYATHWRHREYAGVYFWYGASGNTSGHTFEWDFTVWSATHNEGYSVGSNHTFTIASGTMSNGKMYRLNATSSWPSHHTGELVQFVIEYDEIQGGTSLQLTGLEIVEYTTP